MMNGMRNALTAARLFCLTLAMAPMGAGAHDAAAEDPATVCASFDWPLTRETALFAAPDLQRVESGTSLASDRKAVLLQLKPNAEAGLPTPPSRAPKPNTFAGFLNMPAPAKPGLYQVTLSTEGWIELQPEGEGPRDSVAHTGRKSCPAIRKSVRYRLEAKPFTVAISNAPSDTIRIAVTPAE